MSALIPPQAIDLERNVLGTILLESDALGKVINILDPSHFCDPSNEIIYQAMIILNSESKPIDYLTLKSKLEEQDKLKCVGGIIYIVELTTEVSQSANIEFHARMIVQLFIQRSLIKICSNTINRCYKKDDVFEVSDELLAQLDKALNFIDNGFPRLAAEILNVVRKERVENKGKGLMTSFENLDNLTNGFKSSDLIILAARPAMGKTAFVLQLSTQVVENKKSALFFSLEMSAEQLVRRIESQVSGLNNKNIEIGKLFKGDDEKLDMAHKRITKMGLHIDDTAAISVQKMKLKAQRVKQKHGLDLIVVDYLQLASGTGKGNREQEISEISRGLKMIAKELQVPVIALSQLSRAVEGRSDKRPLLSDLRESGSIEQDADMVAFLYRDKYYNEELEDDITELIIRKHRNGELATLNYEFIGKTTSFLETEKNIPTIKNKEINPFNKLTPIKDVMLDDFEDMTPF